jgi:riboflavin synthase
MFTGIIEQLGQVTKVEDKGSNREFHIESTLAPNLKVDQSLSHNGVCLTVEQVQGTEYQVTAIDETLQKTNLGNLKPGDWVNLERCMTLNGRLDGHIVQGHVDATAKCLERLEKDGSVEFSFGIDPRFASLVIEKGSITLNGISLTIFNVLKDQFTVAIIPYTLNHTNMSQLKAGELVNVEFDMIGKYVNRIHFLNEGR